MIKALHEVGQSSLMFQKHFSCNKVVGHHDAGGDNLCNHVKDAEHLGAEPHDEQVEQ